MDKICNFRILKILFFIITTNCTERSFAIGGVDDRAYSFRTPAQSEFDENSAHFAQKIKAKKQIKIYCFRGDTGTEEYVPCEITFDENGHRFLKIQQDSSDSHLPVDNTQQK